MPLSSQTLFPEFEKLYWNLSRDMGFVWKKIFEQRFPGSQSYILFSLERSGPKRMSELAELLHLTAGAVTIASDKLIENEYIARIRDEKDRRVVRLEMTTKGSKALTELQNEGRKAMKLVFSHLSETDLEFLINTFKQAAENLNDMRREYEK